MGRCPNQPKPRITILNFWIERMAGNRLAATTVLLLLLLLCWSAHQVDAQAPTVVITVDYTPPPGFTPGDNEYRAASGPVVVTCTATGGAGSGNYDYVWMSTCSGCAFTTSSNGETSVISRTAVHSGDNGTHTCTATRGGESESDSFTLNIVGYGVYVVAAATAEGSLPNNGLVIAATGSDTFLRFFCRSNSLVADVGEIIGLDGNVIDSNVLFTITHPRPGEIQAINSGTQGPFPSNEQGVYTFRIPDSTNVTRNINVGVYINGFNTIPSITNPLVFTLGPSSSTLTCTSTGSVATTVTFMRDGTTVGPLRDGESMDFGGVTYQLTQTVTNRAESTYENVLTIDQPLANIVGSSFTCRVENTVGTSPASETLPIMAVIIGYEPVLYSVNESDTTGMVNVTIRLLQGDLTGLAAIPVDVSAANFTATDGSDFSFAPRTLQFDETNTEFTLTVSIMNDDVTEGSEVFFMLAQSSDDRVQIIPDRANVTIIDEDAVTIGFMDTEVTVGESAGPVILNVALLSGSLERDVFVDFTTQDGTAVAPADYTDTVRLLTFGPSSVVDDPVAVPVNISADDLLEINETFSASLTLVPSSLITEILPSFATVTIDDDDQVQIGFDPGSYTVSEEDGSVTLTVCVASGLLARDVEVRFMTENDEALAGEDYSVTDETLTFSSTVNELTVTVPIISDTAFEIQERFVGNLMLLSTDANVNVSLSLASIFIDDDDELTIGFDPVAYSANEDVGMVTLTVGVLEGQPGSGTTISVDYRLLDDTAVVDDDYVMISGQLMFTSTDLSRSIQVQIINDITVELDEVFLGNLFGGPVDPRFTLGPENATVTIVNDDDPPTVSITVNGPPPPGFTPGGPDEYRAASGSYTFICTATGGAGNGDYQYVWTSTCQPSCDFQTSSTEARSEIFRQALHSGDSGTHTCTATRDGQSASDSIDITIVGVGIFVFTGSGVTGTQPNNGLVISTNPDSGRRFRFFCRSNSLTVGVGELIGLEGSPVVASSFFGLPTTTNGGELRVENVVDSEDALTANEQGVYTCRIPLEGGGEREINIGVYPSGFSTIPSITNPLMFTLGSTSPTLTCTSTGSVATTVTFMRDSTTVGPLRDGESMEFGGATYQLTQTVPNRTESTYENVLTIIQPLTDILGSTFTCSVGNTIGTAPVSQPLTIMAIEITSPPEIPTVGDTATFTCTSLLGQANMIEWLLVDGTSETAVDTRNDQATLDLVFNPVSESMNGRVYRCRVTIGGGTVDQDVTVTVEAPDVTVLITPSGSAVVGMSYTLTCTVSGADNLGGTISIAFTGPNSSSGVGTSLQLPLGTLDLNDAGRYTCTATVTSTLLSDDLVSTDTEDINIPIPSPAVNVSGPSGLYFATTNLTLTCTIEIASALGSVAVTAMWIGPQGMLTGTDPVTGGSNLIYESMLTIESLPTTSTATYTCIAMVDAAPSSEFVTPSMETDILTISIVLAPTAPVIMTPTPRTDSIMITWNQASEDVVVNYEISYVYDGTCPNVPVSSPVTLNSTTTSYEVSDLEEFSTYTITVTAINPAGTTDATVTATTMIATPGAAPSSVTATAMNSTTISVQWDEVPCLQQNSDITGYIVRYEPVSGDQPSSELITGTDRMASLTDLLPFTNYSIEVAAVNSNDSMGLFSTTITGHTPATNVQFRFMNNETVNHGIVTITDISESEPLLCVTDRIDCCPPEESSVSNGQWYFPDDSAVPDESGDNFYQASVSAAVRLHRINGMTNGIYRCDIPDTTGNNQTLHIGIYNNGAGGINLAAIQFTLTSALTAETPVFTLTCTSTGGPATNVTWERGTMDLMESSEYTISQIVVDTIRAEYSNQLTVTGRLTGDYRCSVVNIRGDGSRVLNIESTTPPTNVNAMQVGLTSFTVSWTPPNSTPVGYVIFFLGGDDEGSVMVDDGSATMFTIDDRINNREYSITMVALSTHLPSTVTSPETVMLFQPPTVDITPSPATATAGQSYILTCTVTLTMGVSGPPAIEWMGFDSGDTNITVGNVTADSGDPSMHTRTLTFMLRTSHAGDYTCQATSSAVTGVDTEALTVQIPTPTLVLSRDPDVGVTLRHGDTVTLICTIQLESGVVDSNVTVVGSLSGPGSTPMNSVTEMLSSLVYQITLEVTDLQATVSPDTYTCTATVNPGPLETDLTASVQGSITLEVTVELLVNISVDRTDPPGFTPGDSTEYRAASGPQVVTCTVIGGVETDHNYMWTSNSSAFQTTSNRITRTAVHSGDTGTHTCTATDDAGRSGSTSVVFTIVGAGIHVFVGASPTGSQPNNGLVVSNDAASERRFRFFCRSDSLMLNVGELIGLDENPVTGSIFIAIEDPDNGGELRVVNREGTEQELPTDQQGVYTCRIPLQNGTVTEINIGIYPDGFSTMPSITNPLVFTLAPSSSTLTCTSTGSVATTVTFMRDNTTVGPLRDGESIELSGVIYELTQTVTDRSLSTYASVLTITQDVSDIVGHTYTCNVANVLGSNTSEELVLTGIDTEGGDQPLTVGVMHTITCRTSLNISDIVWIDDMDTIVASNSEGVQQLDLVFNPINDSIHDRMYTCTITTLVNLVISETVNITVTVPMPAITVSVNSQGSTTAGGSYTLTCTIMEEVVGLTNMPSLQWQNSSGQEIVNGEGITVGEVQQTDTTAILVLTFDLVRTSHGGEYSCQGTLDSPPGLLMNTSEQTVTVSIPQPTVTVAVPTDPLYTGTNVTLTCNIVLNDQVDSPVIVNVTWTGPGGEITSVILSGIAESPSPFQATLTFAPLISSDDGNYTCEATVGPDDGDFITMSLPGSGTGTVTVQDLPTPQVEITPEGPSTAGMEHTLTCRVTSAENLFSSPDVVWMYSNGTEESPTVIDSEDAITVGQAVTEGSVTTSILTFNPLRTSHGGMYTCMANISIPEASVAITNDASATVNVQIPAPNITFTQSPAVDPPYAGTRFILTCTITLAQAVDTAVVVEEMWSRDTLPLNNNRTTIDTIRSDSANVYTTTVEISPLSSDLAEDDGNYSCSATITPQASEFVTGVTADDLQSITVEELPQPNVTIESMGSRTAGEDYELICTVVVVEGLVVQPTVTWIYPTNDPMNELNITVGSAQRNGVSTTLTLTFNPLRTSHMGRYTCQAGVSIPEVSIDVMGMQTFDVTVEIPPPSVTVTSSRPDPLYEGTQFFLTCNIILDEVVDLRVTVAPTWNNSDGMISNTNRTLLSSVQQTASFTYSATLTFNPLQSSDTDTYTCFVTVSFMSEFILSGESMSMEEVTVEDLPPPSVSITVIEANPNAGEVYTLTCTATVVENLVVMPILTWTDPLNGAVAGDQDDAGTTSTLTLMFNPLRTLQGGVYTCRADIDIDTISFELSANSSQSVNVQIPQPTLAIVPNLEPAYNGTNFTLTCTITLNDAVDAPVSVVGMWMKGSDTLQTSDDTCIEVSDTTAVGTSDSMYEVTLSFNPLGNETRDGGSYTCTATVGPQQGSANAEFVCGSSNGRDYELLVDALPLPVATFSGSPEEATLNEMYTLTCSVEVVEGLALPPIVTWIDADSMIVTENVMEQVTDGTITTRDLVFSSLSAADLGVYVCEGCVTISKVFINDIDRHCGLTMPCVATETPNIDSVSCSSTSGTVLRVEWTEATATQDPCNRSGGATRYEVDVLRHVQDGNTLSTVPFNELEYPRNVEISLLETSVTGLAPGVPYQVRVAAASLGGFGNPAIENCFSRQLEPPQLTDVRAERLDAETMNVSWTPLTLVQAMGFVRYRISYQPQVNRKRQSGSVVVGGDRSFETIDGLMSGVVYDVTVEPINTDPNGQDLSAAGSPRTVVAEAEPTSGSNIAAIAGAVIGVIIAVIVIAVIIVVVIYCYRSRRYGKVSLKTERMFELTEQGKPHEASSIRPLVPSPAKEPSFVEKSVDAEPVPAPVPSVEVTDRMKPISAISFRDHVQEMHDERDKRFEAEYQSLGSDPVAPHEVAKRPYNRPKNRFANIFPYDHSRVKLKEIAGEEGSNYINACFLNGYNRENAYIASQGPMPNTVNDFWRMIWEYKLQNIVMLTKCMEAGRRKCEQYWADNMGDDFETPDKKVVVTTTSVMPFADFDIRTFSVKRTDKPDAEPLRVTQYHFTAWPDHGVPKFATSLITFIRRVQRGHNKNDGFPLLVHCSAGVGRTGTFVLLDSMLERIKSEDSVNVYEFLFNLRSKRVLMVQTLPQYVFIHDALDELITCGETDISASSLRVKVNRMQKTIPGKGITGFAEQFQLLDQVSRKPEEEDCSDALEHYNQTKNRNPERVPYNMSRARLRPTGEDGSEYINASFVDGYKRRNAYIATQAPLPNTVNDFWRMMWEFKSKTIVMLCNMVEEGLEACHPYWPSKENETTNYGSIAVTLQSKAAYGDFSIRKFNIHEEKGAASEGFVVTLFHHTEWPEHSKLASCTSLIEMIDILTKTQMNTGNRSITVMCNDGVGRTGTFITIHAQLERLKTEGVVDFFQYIKSARVHRAWLIPEVFQYAYCHEVLADYIDTFDNYANFKDMI